MHSCMRSEDFSYAYAAELLNNQKKNHLSFLDDKINTIDAIF